MASKTKVVLGRGQGSMPIDTKPLPEPKMKRQPPGYGDMKAPPMGNYMDDSAPAAPGRALYGGGRDELGPNYGPPVERMPPMMGGGGIGHMGDMGDSLNRWRGAPGQSGEHGGVNPGGGGRGIFMDARINPDGKVKGRNSDNEFDEWTGDWLKGGAVGGNGGGQYKESAYGDSSGLIDSWLKGGAVGARESMLGLDNPRIGTRVPTRPSPKPGGKTPWKPIRKFKKKRRVNANTTKENYTGADGGGVIKRPKGGE